MDDLVSLLWRRKLLFAFLSLALFAAAAVQIALLPPAYTASSTLFLDPRETHYADLPNIITAVSQTSDLSLDLVNSEMDVLEGPELAGRVATALRLQDNPDFLQPNSSMLDRVLPWRTEQPQTEEKKLEAAVQKYAKSLRLFNDGKSFVISASFTAATPELAQRVLTKHVEFYLADQRAFKQKAIARAQRWLTPELTRLAAKLRGSESELQAYRASHHLTRVAGETIVSRQLSDLTSQLATARTDLTHKIARYDELRRGTLDTEQLSSLTLSHLRGQEAAAAEQMAGLRSRYGDRSPALVAPAATLASVRERIAAELGRMKDAAANDVVIARGGVVQLEEQVARLEQQVGKAGDADLIAAGLQREVDAERKLYDDLLSRSKQVAAQYEIQDADVRVVSAPIAPQQPSFPRRGLLGATAAAASVLLSALLVVVLERFRGEPPSLGEIERNVGVPGLASIPRLRVTRGQPWPPVLEPLTQPAVAFQTLANSIAFQGGSMLPQLLPRVIAVVSASPGEGKTTVAALLASSLAQGGARVLLVDADMRRRALSRRMGLSYKTGLIRLLEEGGTLAESVVRDPDAGLDVLAAERNCLNPYRLTRTQALPAVLAAARMSYEAVVIDTPPLAVVDDALPFAAAADSTIVVASCGLTVSAALQGAVQRLRLAGARNLGLVLNRVPNRRKAYQPGMEAVGASCRLYFNDSA
ncbi:MAG: AAA family ATPase [Acetobacteraceae bacterium]|nr:AAA family ATPase [Acetobacteraceae bacterium]